MTKPVLKTSPTRFSIRRTSLILTVMIATLTIGSLSTSFANTARDEVEVVDKWSGKIAFEDLRTRAPSNKMVVDQKAWTKLWRSWRPTDAVPAVDFSKHVLLVETAKGPNKILTSSLILTRAGELRYEAGSTKKEGSGFGYLIMAVPKQGIVSINGRLLVSVPVMPKSATPTTRKPGHVPTDAEIDRAIADVRPNKPKPQNMLPPQTRPENNSAQTPQTNPVPTQLPGNSEESFQTIKVEIIGSVRTGLMSYESQTKTALVVANGIVWSLDFQNNPAMFQIARTVGSDLCRITGTLKKQIDPNRLPDPNRTADRLVVMVESISRWKGQSRPLPMQNANNGLANNNPILPNQLGNQSGVNPVAPKQILPTQPNAPGQGSATKPSALPTPTRKVNSFRSIMVSITGGKSPAERRKTVTSSGLVKIEVPVTKYMDQFNLDPAMLDQLHQFVAQTDWKSIPAVSRTNGADKNVTNYSISVETVQGTKRFFMDQPAAEAQPVVIDLFKLMQRPK